VSAIFLSLVAPILVQAGCAPGPAEPPNVLLVIADDLGVDKVGAYSADADSNYAATAAELPQTPTIDHLAEVGVRFTDAWAAPSCGPSRASLYTGTYPFRHGIGDSEATKVRGLREDAITIAALLRDAGYATALFGKWHLGDGEVPESWGQDESWLDHLGEVHPDLILPPVSLGWDHFQGTLAGLKSEGSNGYFDWVRVSSSLAQGTWAEHITDYSTTVTTNDSLAWINAQSTPWMATVAYSAPHSPWESPPTDCYGGPAPEGDLASYRAMTECMDHHLARLLEGIEDLDETVVIFVGDNGTPNSVAEAPYQDGRGKLTVYESGIRVPLIVADGSDLSVAGASRVVAEPVHLVDLFSTIAELANVDGGAGVDGVSILPLWSGEAESVRDWVYSERIGETDADAVFRKGKNKLLIKAVEQDGVWCTQKLRLFQLDRDRFEADDLAEQKPDLVDALFRQVVEVIVEEEGAWLDLQECES
jgi:arylsulfatase A-like enzyme